ncbi:MAG: hypothetical protein EPO08_20775 [Rhodospirillaceae bacterium]|nr:MAG: hypothetical protein EPO08_20775 [Rhodospirillaceae bacterium]
MDILMYASWLANAFGALLLLIVLSSSENCTRLAYWLLVRGRSRAEIRAAKLGIETEARHYRERLEMRGVQPAEKVPLIQMVDR